MLFFMISRVMMNMYVVIKKVITAHYVFVREVFAQ